MKHIHPNWIRFFILVLVVSEIFGLVVSSRHLTEVYMLFDQHSDPLASLGLAIALETAAFVLSIVSTTFQGVISPWAGRGAMAALGLVWIGNFYSMYRNADGLPMYLPLLFSCFVPIGTYLTGKVVGDLFLLYRKVTAPQDAIESPVIASAHSPAPEGLPVPIPHSEPSATAAVTPIPLVAPVPTEELRSAHAAEVVPREMEQHPEAEAQTSPASMTVLQPIAPRDDVRREDPKRQWLVNFLQEKGNTVAVHRLQLATPYSKEETDDCISQAVQDGLIVRQGNMLSLPPQN